MASWLNYFKTIGKSFFNRLFERSIRVYIQKHLGEFLLEKLTTDQVDLGLDGGTLAGLYLNSEAINERLESVNVPFTLLEGYIHILSLKVPWTEISTESILVEVDGLMLTIKIKEEELDDGIDVKSMLDSMTQSMVEEVMKAEVAASDAQKISEAGKGASPFESVELMSELILSITSRIQVILKNVVIRTEKIPGVCIELQIKELDYYDRDCTTTKEKKTKVPPTPEGFSTKVVEISDVSVKIEEVICQEDCPRSMDPVEQSSVAFDIAMSSPPNSGNYMQASMVQSIYPGTDPWASPTGVASENKDDNETTGLIPIITMDKTQTISFQIKNNDQLPGPSVNVTWNMESVHILMCPKLLSLITDILNADKEAGGNKKAHRQEPMTREDFELCRQVSEEERRDSMLDGISVPPLTMDKHMEMMQGATADSVLSEDDMFYSTYQAASRNPLPSFDVGDSASVSTFPGQSTFSTTNASVFSHVKKVKERTANRSLDEHTEDIHKINFTVPFFSVTMLLEDPEPSSSSSVPGSHKSANASPSFPSSSSQQRTASFMEHQQQKGNRQEQFSSHPLSGHTFVTSSPKSPRSDDESGDDYEDDEEEEKGPKTKGVGGLRNNDLSSHTAKKKLSANSSLSIQGSKFQEVANKFFTEISKLDVHLPLQELRDQVAQILARDYLGLLSKPVQLEVIHEKKASDSTMKVKATCGKLELTECLFDSKAVKSDFAKTSIPKLPQYSMVGRRPWSHVQLLNFDANNMSDAHTNMYEAYKEFDQAKARGQHSALTLNLEWTSARRHQKEAANTLSLHFGKLTSEVDVTLIDRLASILNIFSDLDGSHQASQLIIADSSGHLDEAMKDEQSSGSVPLAVNISASHATLRVRFPIPDLRPDRPPLEDWCRRSLHKEVLVLELEAPEVRTKVKSDSFYEFEVQVFKASAYLQEDINQHPVLFGEVTVADHYASPHDAHHFNWPRILIKINNKATSVLETEVESDTSGNSMEPYVDLCHKKPSSPFSHRKTMYQRDDLSSTDQHKPPVDDEMVMPGDATELKDFREDCMNHTTVSIELTVPSITAFLHHKDFLELLYNRFNNDLLMWEPMPKGPRHQINPMMPSNTNLGVYHLVKHYTGDDLQPSSIEDELSDSDNEEETMMYSIHDTHINKTTDKPTPVKPASKMCFSLNIGKGRLLAVIPHPEKCETNPHLHGEMMITLKDGILFSVNQHAGDPDLKYLCFQAGRVHMYHNSHVTVPVKPGILDHIRDTIPEHLHSRIYRSDRWASESGQGRAGWGGESPDMLTLVVKTTMDTLTNIKNFTLALGFDGGTLRHEMHHSGESWISQAIDLFDLKDFPILGYTMPKIKTEIHVQLHHCCIDYRPLYLPVCAFLTIEQFSVCTNIIAESSTSLIQLIIDNAALYLSSKAIREVNLVKDYVCIGEMDQLKIWLQFCFSKSGKQKAPKSDLRFMCNQLNIRTCADSTRALLDIIQYFVDDRDLIIDGDDSTIISSEGDGISAQGMDEEDEASTPSNVIPASTLTPEQEANVMSALEEAMVDCPTPHVQHSANGKEIGGTRVFFHCDGQDSGLNGDLGEVMQITVDGLSDSSDFSPDDIRLEGHGGLERGKSNTSDDFEILDCNFKDVPNIEGSHQVQLLTQEPIDLNESFISKPTSSCDHLKAPSRFPDPEYQYTLREISVTWQIFGGSDFTQPGRSSTADQIELMKGRSPNSPRRKISDSSPGKKVRQRGGEMRDFNSLMELELNKVRFCYEIYPSSTKQSSRFKLLVNNIEIRDRMQSSEINKFLVKLIDKEHPEQSSVYMLMFSGVFTRPEHLPFREECQVKAFCLPIKLNVDQGSLNFLRKFISHVSESDTDSATVPPGGRASPSGSHSSPRSSISSGMEPIMRVGEPTSKEQSMDETELLMQFNDISMKQSLYLQERLNERENLDMPQEDLPVFINSFVLLSDVTIKLDYRGKRCDMDQGVMGVMLGVASLTGSVITLRRINCHKGILGWSKLLMYIANEWLSDIRTKQIHSILKGVGSFSILFQIFQGVTDLIRLPIEQYQKDRRIIRGIQRGANSFTFNTLMALLELTNKVVGSIQYCAELGYDMMSPGPSVRRRKQLRHRNRQPRTTAEGAKAALQLMTEGVKESASNLSAIVSEERAHKGYVGLVGGTLRNATPECLFKPLALLAEAGGNIVQGARNQVDPSVMREEEDRWKQA